MKRLPLILLMTLLLTACSTPVGSAQLGTLFSNTDAQLMIGGGEFANEIPTYRTEARLRSLVLPGDNVSLTANTRLHNGRSDVGKLDFSRFYVGPGIKSGGLSAELVFSKKHYRLQGQVQRDIGPWRLSNAISFEQAFSGEPFKATRNHAGFSYRFNDAPFRFGCEYTTGPADKRHVTDFLLCGISSE